MNRDTVGVRALVGVQIAARPPREVGGGRGPANADTRPRRWALPALPPTWFGYRGRHSSPANAEGGRPWTIEVWRVLAFPGGIEDWRATGSGPIRRPTCSMFLELDEWRSFSASPAPHTCRGARTSSGTWHLMQARVLAETAASRRGDGRTFVWTAEQAAAPPRTPSGKRRSDAGAGLLPSR